MSAPFTRALVIVLDGVGIGELPDAPAYGDHGCDTVGNIARRVPLRLPTLRALGLGRVASLGPAPAASSVDTEAGWRGPTPSALHAAAGRMAEASAGKDSVTGHWEMMGIVLDRPFPLFPNGFPDEVLRDLSRAVGRGVLGNKAASGTAIIDELGPEHVRTGSLIVYTSADSVFQIAAHEDVVPVPELYRACEIAYTLVAEGLGVGRVIARPFVGAPGRFTRTANRRDFARPPSGETLLDRLTASDTPVVAIGKIEDLFAGRGITRAVHTRNDEEGMDQLERAIETFPRGFVFTNLVDFDTLYGHRGDIAGYARNLERFDARLGRLLPRLRADDLLVVTADHGNDPTDASTDHSREYVPLIAAGALVQQGVELGTRRTFADLGQTLADLYGVGSLAHGTTFLGDLA